ncbi:LysR family transcriptional regulator [Agarivorans sp. TSD2052]|uniref:LysR family transcriptional regulator n=1 Tax=Agarivorans sp. TSD2052 TaxID=2937286 RepID=UPI00200E213C|nr:LysR family transcriptional regulator [Agarivorans sp. TSD2052]UPW17616.1 LysR family transcriptional regulator [Agarivorans sp. TSD2052]
MTHIWSGCIAMGNREDETVLTFSSHNLECFIAAAEMGTFNKAARKLGKSSSTVSRWIGELEDELGYLLFDRQSNGLVVVLSEKGELLLPKAKIAIEYLQKFENLALSIHSDSTPLKLAISFGELIDGEGIADVISRLKTSWPNLQISLKNADMTHIQLALDNKLVDFALGIVADSLYPNVGGALVGEENTTLIAHPNNPLCGEPNVQLDMLLSQTSIWSAPYEQTHKYDTALFKSLEMIECSDANTVVSLVKSDLGIALLPEYIVHPAIQSKQVVSLNFDKREIDPSFQLMLYYRLDYPHREVIDEIILALRDWFGYTK